MHRTKKMTVLATGVALLMAAGMSSAMANGNKDNEHNNHEKVTICHATGSESHPYQRINVSKNAAEAHDHHQHNQDLLFEDADNNELCPTTPVTPPSGGDDDGDNGQTDGDCVASSESGDQGGLVNVHADNLAANTFCQSEILNYVTVLGVSLGSSSIGSVVLDGGAAGLLSGLSANVDVLANVVVLF